MIWKPVVVGVDASPEAARAAALAWSIASGAGTSCHLVHAVQDASAALAAADLPVAVTTVNEAVVGHSRHRLEETLRGAVPDDVTRGLEIRVGQTPAVLTAVAHEREAGLVVLGGKHHRALARWLGGSTAHHVVRTMDIPVLVTGSPTEAIRRILAAADLSFAAGPTIEAATRFARLTDGRLRVVHVVEQVPVLAELPGLVDPDEMRTRTEARLNEHIWPMVQYPDAETAIVEATMPQGLVEAVEEWGADLLVVGSHGKRWVDRLLVGSATNWLLNHLPTSLLVVPVKQPKAGATRLGLPPGA